MLLTLLVALIRSFCLLLVYSPSFFVYVFFHPRLLLPSSASSFLGISFHHRLLLPSSSTPPPFFVFFLQLRLLLPLFTCRSIFAYFSVLPRLRLLPSSFWFYLLWGLRWREEGKEVEKEAGHEICERHGFHRREVGDYVFVISRAGLCLREHRGRRRARRRRAARVRSSLGSSPSGGPRMTSFLFGPFSDMLSVGPVNDDLTWDRV